MITAHGKEHLTFFDGVEEHRIAHGDFVPMKPHDKGGIHPAITEEHETWFFLPDEVDLTDCPITPVESTVRDLLAGTDITVRHAPIVAYLQARYGPNDAIITVPIDGDENAQHLHWIHRNAEERKEMRSFLEWLGVWRLHDDGSPATAEEREAMRIARFHEEAEELRRAEEEIAPPKRPRFRRRR